MANSYFLKNTLNRHIICIGKSNMPKQGFTFNTIKQVSHKHQNFRSMIGFIKFKLNESYEIHDESGNMIELQEFVRFVKHCKILEGPDSTKKDNMGYYFGTFNDSYKNFNKNGKGN